MNESSIIELVSGQAFSIWFLIGAALVFFMQCGFAMVESGFTRAKNAGNIIMKNLMDFCIGTVVFILIGFSLLCGENTFFGLIGKPSLQIFTDFSDFPWSSFVFNLVFCATTATIVSGAMAERTKFISYCIYSGVISAVIYPIEAHWVWGGGWLSGDGLGFLDFAGSACIHMVGGTAALIGAAILGPRIGKFSKSGKPKAILGHSMTLGALGVFILWFGWYGFNGAAADSTAHLGQIFMSTTIAPAVATVVTMVITWIQNGKPDVSMTLNGSLAGLVAITAPCADVDALGSIIIGAVAGCLVVFGVWLLDHKLKIDDPVGAVAVHGFNGIWGTLSVGLFATGAGQDAEYGPGGVKGLFYGGGFEQLGVQALGVVCILAWTAITCFILFKAIKHTIGLRASKEEELIGLDATEHGLASAYADFAPTMASGSYISTDTPIESKPVSPSVPPVSVEKAVPVESYAKSDAKFTKIVVICKSQKLNDLLAAYDAIQVTGVTVTNVLGCGMQRGQTEYYRGVEVDSNLLPKVKVEVVVCKVPTKTVIETTKNALYTGHIGDGKIFVYDIENVIKVRTGEEGYDALQDD